MNIVDLPRNEKSAQGFERFYARQKRAQRIVIMRNLHWSVRKSTSAEQTVNSILEAGRRLAREYMRLS